MRAITFQGIESVAVEEVPEPSIEDPGDVVLEIELAGICGSDLHVFHGREVGLDRGTVLGHEYVGRVLEVGSAVESLRQGDRVVGPFTTSCGACFYCRSGLTCRCTRGQLFGWREDGHGLHGAHAERLRVPLADSTLLAVDDSLPAAEVLLVGDVLATGFYSAELGGVDAQSVVAVVGCGPVGLMAVLAARERDARRIYAFDRLAERLDLAERLGARPVDVERNDVLDPVRQATDGRGVDVVLEAVGSAAATRLAVDLLRPGGTIAAIGVHTEPHLAFSPGEAYDKNLTYRAGRCPARRYTERLVELVRRGDYDLGSLISHRLPLDAGVEAYDLFARRLEGCTKVVLSPAG